MVKKKLMLLGGISYLIPAIKAAQAHGIHTITVDYLPDNIAHKYSDEYHNLSIIDKDAVLHLAQELKIDGIVSFAVDPGVVTAAYVAEKMGLPFQCSYESACILQDKARFREFLATHGFNTPKAYRYSDKKDAQKDAEKFDYPIIVKPVDSAGSKGVSKVETPQKLDAALDYAFNSSISHSIIIEDYLEKEGFSSGSESFAIDNKLVFNGFYDQFFDNDAINPYTPSGECWPTSKPSTATAEIKSELQRLFNLLEVKTGIFNIEWRICRNGKIYLMEVSPRAGGNRLAEMLKIATGVDIIDAEVCKAVGLPFKTIQEPSYNGYFSILVLHPEKAGEFKNIQIDESFNKKYVLEEEIRVNAGASVMPFTGANAAIGTLFLHFQSNEEMISTMENISKYIKINIE